jgi:hypothetical protein
MSHWFPAYNLLLKYFQTEKQEQQKTTILPLKYNYVSTKSGLSLYAFVYLLIKALAFLVRSRLEVLALPVISFVQARVPQCFA